jgi:hypothetical protein
MLLPFAILLAATTLSASVAELNGRWNIIPQREARNRVWWLEVKGAGTNMVSGKFTGAPGGQVDAIPNIKVEGEELVWVFDLNKEHRTYHARVVKGMLQGTMELAGQPDKNLSFTGKRAPLLKEIDDDKWKKGKPVELFNGKDMTGWSPSAPGRKLEWYVENGSMKNKDKAADIVSGAKFWNFDLHIEYKVAQQSNSGVGLRARYEVQIFGDHGEPSSQHGNGALYSRIVPTLNATKAPGEWQTFDIRLIGRQVTVVLNGKAVIDHKTIDGFTAMATDANEDQPGPLSLQGDHGPVEFRKITVTPLTR